MGRRARQEFFPDENPIRKSSQSAALGEVGVLSGEPDCNPAGVSSGNSLFLLRFFTTWCALFLEVRV